MTGRSSWRSSSRGRSKGRGPRRGNRRRPRATSRTQRRTRPPEGRGEGPGAQDRTRRQVRPGQPGHQQEQERQAVRRESPLSPAPRPAPSLGSAARKPLPPIAGLLGYCCRECRNGVGPACRAAGGRGDRRGAAGHGAACGSGATSAATTSTGCGSACGIPSPRSTRRSSWSAANAQGPSRSGPPTAGVCSKPYLAPSTRAEASGRPSCARSWSTPTCRERPYLLNVLRGSAARRPTHVTGSSWNPAMPSTSSWCGPRARATGGPPAPPAGWRTAVCRCHGCDIGTQDTRSG